MQARTTDLRRWEAEGEGGGGGGGRKEATDRKRERSERNERRERSWDGGGRSNTESATVEESNWSNMELMKEYHFSQYPYRFELVYLSQLRTRRRCETYLLIRVVWPSLALCCGFGGTEYDYTKVGVL